MISTRELLAGNIITDLSIEQQHNLEDLKAKLNIIRLAWNKPMIITSGFRTIYQHRLIYSKQGNDKPPMGSQHLQGKAADVADPYGALGMWLHQNPDVLEQADLYCEITNGPWQHFQTAPFKSYKPGGTRWFNP